MQILQTIINILLSTTCLLLAIRLYKVSKQLRQVEKNLFHVWSQASPETMELRITKKGQKMLDKADRFRAMMERYNNS